MIRRWLAGQFARPSGWLGRLLIGPWLDRLGGRMNAVAFEQLSVRPGERVLEAGFGGGALLAVLLEAGAEVVGIDPSEAMLRRGRRRFAAELKAGRLRLLQGSAHDLPIADATVDKACSVNNLYFWTDPPAAMAEFARAVRPGGLFVLCFQSPEAVRAWPGHRHGFAAYDEADVRGWMEATGFTGLRTVRGADPKLGDFLCVAGLREPA